MNIYEKQTEMVQKIKVLKSEYNVFGKYSFRNLESIFQEIKPFLLEYKCSVIPNDELVMIGDRYYIKATMRLVNNEKPTEYIDCVSYAREAEVKKGMDDSQITGTASSYARKYALSGLFNIDNNKDVDSMDNSEPTKASHTTDKNALIEKIISEIERTGEDEKAILNKAKAKDFIHLKPEELQAIITWLGKKDTKTKELKMSDIDKVMTETMHKQ